MILDFRVRNFRSLRDAATLSFVASSDRTHAATHLIETGFGPARRVLRSAALYGPNASGKSTLIFALATMAKLVLQSTVLTDAQLAEEYTPFRLDAGSASEPTEFEINLLLDGVRYEYGFAYDGTRIHHEWLTVYRKAKGQHWFERRWDPTRREEVWEKFSTHFVGERETWRRATRPQALFLTTATQLNSDLLRPLHQWFQHGLAILPAGGLPPISWTATRLDDVAFKERVLALLRASDLHVADIKTVPATAREATFATESSQPTTLTGGFVEVTDIQFGHQVADGPTVWFDRRHESLGTQRLLAYAAPILEALERGSLLVIDEIDSSLHPLVTRFVVGLFNDPSLSKRGAQLLITTHDTSLLDTAVMRRDQFWLIEKDEGQASRLLPLTDFSPRGNEALERGYLRGRYGALPLISDIGLH
jgi:hypothetical protein